MLGATPREQHPSPTEGLCPNRDLVVGNAQALGQHNINKTVVLGIGEGDWPECLADEREKAAIKRGRQRDRSGVIQSWKS